MTTNAQREAHDEALESATELKRLAAQRLAAHRSRRSADPAPAPPRPASTQPSLTPAAQRIREAVAARYQQAPSYRDYLITDTAPPTAVVPQPAALPTPAAPAPLPPPVAAAPPIATPSETAPPLQVRPFEPLPAREEVAAAVAWTAHPQPAALEADLIAEELADLNDEIAFRLDPEFHDHLLEPLPIQANIIEFPRQLVATHKARPRLAEGPLRSVDEPPAITPAALPPAPADPEPPGSQLRIFEVDTPAAPPTQTPAEREADARREQAIRIQVELDELDASPEWQTLVLEAREEEDEAPSWVPAPVPEMPAAWKARLEGRIELHPASFELRSIAWCVDTLCVTASTLAFITVAALAAGPLHHRLNLAQVGITLAAIFLALLLLYHALFLSLGSPTPGMNYANLVFRSLRDEEPARAALRKRWFANVLAVLPLGLGLLWAVFDPQSLGWHDRLSGTYIREF